MKERKFYGWICAVTMVSVLECGCCRLQPMRALVDPVAAMPAPTGPYMIPRQGYLEKGYIESSTPYSPGWNPQ